MLIQRQHYLDKLIAKKHNGLVKIVTGVRRCGKSFLLFKIFREYLLREGVLPANIIELALDEMGNIQYRNPLELDKYLRKRISDTNAHYYILLDEIQNVEAVPNPYLPDSDAKITFVDVILGLMKLDNVDVYITGSNSKMLSSDILTAFRGRGDEVRVWPLSFAEFKSAFSGEARNAWREYYTYGGMPFVLSLASHAEKSKYLKDLFTKTYLRDVLDHNKIFNDSDVLEMLINIVSSAMGSLTNPSKLAKTFLSKMQRNISSNTISRYLEYFIDAFLLEKAFRYDIKGKNYLDTPLKYYFTDVGLRNARLNFRQQEENHIMENIIYNELRMRDFDVDVGIVEYNTVAADGKKLRTQLEVDFVANKGSKRYYIQSALSIDDEAKREQEINSLKRVADSFKKIVVVKDNIMPWHDENGILYLGIEDFLLDASAMDL